MPRDWDVLESDGVLVALLRSAYVLSPDGRIVGRRASGQIVAEDGNGLGSWRRDEAGLRVEFGEPTIGEPFVRMAILVAALIDD